MARVLPVLLFFAFFWTVLFGDRQFGYRDGAHFYYPLYRYVQEELTAGRLPLWNPYENLGQPLAANPTTALFYPGKLIFFLPFDFTTLYGWFVSGHVLLAAFLAYRLARAWRCSESAAVLAGICYAFGGNVLFQHANVPFLIGAAWFPESLLQADRMFRLKSFENAVLWGAVLALMILGGDPQAAYHAILCTVLLFIIKSRGCRRTRRSPRIDERVETHRTRKLRRSTGSTPGSLLMICGLFTMFGLAAVQILPAWELSRLSDRALPTHGDATYLFSVPIWRLVEFFWPNVGGVQFPVNARWFNAFNDDVWGPSFYMGLVPMLLAAWNIFFCLKEPGTKAVLCRSPRTRRDVFLTIMLFVFVLGSLGKWGGVYPLLNLLPGYGMFRFPAKLLTVAALPLAILAARGFDRLFPRNCDEKRVYAFTFYYPLFPILFLFSLIFFDQYKQLDVSRWTVPDCLLFGPYQRWTADRILRDNAARVFILPILFGLIWIVYRAIKSKNEPGPVVPTALDVYKGLFVLLIAGDLFFANHWMIATVPRVDFQEKSPLSVVITDHGSSSQRIYRFPAWYPLVFTACASEERLSEIVRWERATLSPKYSLTERIGVVDVLGTMYPKEFYRIAGGLRWEIEHGEPGDLEKRLEDLGVQFVVAACGTKLDAEKIPLSAGWPDDCSLWKLRNPRPRNYTVVEPNWLEMDVELAEAGIITIPEQYWPGWRAFVDDKEVPIHSVEKIFRGVDLPAGKHHLRMIYQPLMFQIGGIVSCLGLIILTTLFRGRIFRLFVHFASLDMQKRTKPR